MNYYKNHFSALAEVSYEENILNRKNIFANDHLQT